MALQGSAPFYRRFRLWILPIIALFGLFVFTVGALSLYGINQRSYLQQKSQQISDGIYLNLTREIKSRVAVLQVLGRTPSILSVGTFEKMAASVIKEYPGFYAVNLVSPQGIIYRVYPEAPNAAALGKNLFEREDLNEYLKLAKEKKTPTMSHRVMTFQGVFAFALYTPLYDENGKFLGWLNGVVDIDNWLASFMISNHLDHVRARIQWNQGNRLEFGPKNIEQSFKYEYEILNQKIYMNLGLSATSADFEMGKYYFSLILLATVLLLLAFLLTIQLNISKIKLMESNETLELKNILIGSIAHDVSTPLASLNLLLDLVMGEKRPITDLHKIRIRSALKAIGDTLKSVKYLHANEMGILKIPAERISLIKVISTAVSNNLEQAQQKNIQFDIVDIPEDLKIVADENSLCVNVLANVLSNAIKFSPDDGRVIKIYYKQFPAQVELIIEDQGVGLTDEQLKFYKDHLRIQSHLGTRGEIGTGLGLLQIHSFMTMYGGSSALANNPGGGCKMSLIFKTKV